MKRLRIKVAAGIVSAGVLGFGAVAVAGGHSISERLTGYEEMPALSTPGVGKFEASINKGNSEIRYELSFSGLESDVTQAHIHFENHTNNGPIVVFLCSNLASPAPPPGTQPCPAGGGTVSGTIKADNVGAGAAANGIAAGEFDEFVRAIRAGATYVNVHSVNRAGGEIRAQLGDNSKRSNNHDH